MRKGSFMPGDLVHEQFYNLPMKSAIKRNRQNSEILANISYWFPIRGRLFQCFENFVFSKHAWKREEESTLQTESEPKRARERGKLDNLVMHIAESLNLNYENIVSDEVPKELISFGKEKLSCEESQRLLASNKTGKDQFHLLVQERFVNRTTPLHAPIKKSKIPTFSYLDEKNLKKPVKVNHSRKELIIQNKLIAVLSDRPTINVAELQQYQLTDMMALVKELDVKGNQIPNIRSNKSSAVNDFILRVVPTSFVCYRPQSVDFIILEGENILSSPPFGLRTVEEHIKTLFDSKIKPNFKFATSLFLMFDDANRCQRNDLKLTDKQRYQNGYQDLSFTEKYLIEDYNLLFKNKENKKRLKTIMARIILQNAADWIMEGQTLYLNGIFPDGETKSLKALMGSGYMKIETSKYTLKMAESDTKIFELMCMLPEQETILVHSLDTDVKLLGIFHAAQNPNQTFFIKSGHGITPNYFNPQGFVNYMQLNYFQEEGRNFIIDHAEALLRVYSALGCDYTAGFHGISHGFGMKIFDDMSRNMVLKTRNHWMKWLLNTYHEKNRSIKHLFSDTDQIDQQIMQDRGIIKAMKGSEEDCIPLPSVIDLQFKRSQLIVKIWTNKVEEYELPEDFGYSRTEQGLTIQFQDFTDEFYTLPTELLKGCFCKGHCEKRCQCKKDSNRESCSRYTCKHCNCFKRAKEGQEEDVIISTRYQNFMDNLSSGESEDDNEDDESDLDELLEASLCSEEELEFDEEFSTDDELPDI